MTPVLHQGLTVERWRVFPWDQRILHMVSELNRAAHWIRKGDEGLADDSIERVLELVDLSIEAGFSQKPVSFLKEFLRWRELLAGFYKNTAAMPYREFRTLLKALIDLDPSVHNLELKI